MNYAQTLDYLFQKLPMFHRMGSAAYRKDPHNTVALCEALGNPQHRFRSIHVGGTNGKGSVSHMLAAVLQQSGYKTGLYTSPHLHDFRERIRVNGALADPAFIVAFTERVKGLIETLEPSFFEITVAMAFDYFAQQGVDIAVIEVGLGGRLDSTNIIRPELSVITNIGWDHMNLLGDTLEAIAGEKAGIIKEGVPVVIGEKRKETAPVFEGTAREKNAPLTFAEEQLTLEEQLLEEPLQKLVYREKGGKEWTIRTDLTGIYQAKNVRTALSAVAQLEQAGFSIPEKDLLQALRNVKKTTGLQGRWDVIASQPRIVLEVAHNEDGMRQMLAHLEQSAYEKLHLVLGMVKDKDADKVLRLLPREAVYYFTQAAIPRALPFPELREKASHHGLQGSTYPNVGEALEAARTAAAPGDMILVCGSIFLVAEVDRSCFS